MKLHCRVAHFRFGFRYQLRQLKTRVGAKFGQQGALLGTVGSHVGPKFALGWSKVGQDPSKRDQHIGC